MQIDDEVRQLMTSIQEGGAGGASLAALAACASYSAIRLSLMA